MVRIVAFALLCLVLAWAAPSWVWAQTSAEALATFKRLQAERQEQGLEPLTMVDLIVHRYINR